MKKKYLYILFLLLINTDLQSQSAVLGPESSNWYFGENAGITFNTLLGSPKTIRGSLITEEGCASISDSEGNLLFYCSGETIWTRTHKVMKNGSGLPGGHSATQAVLIVQKPGKNDIFFVFNTENLGGNLSYSIVDMTKDNNLGQVISRNNILSENIGEKLTAVYHIDDRSVWLLTKLKNEHKFRAFLISEDNDFNYVDSYIPLNFELSHKYSSMGYLNFSADGKKLASASYSASQVELYDFDRQTGVVSNPIVIPFPDELNTYGVCFSPDSKKLYVSYYKFDAYLAQFDLTNYDSISIVNSKKIIAEYHDGFAVGAIQAGPDEKLYVSRYKQNYLSVINRPNEYGAECDYTSNGVYLSGAMTRLGLPNFAYVNRYSEPKPDLSFHNVYFEVGNIEGNPGDTVHKISISAKILNDSIKVENVKLDAVLEYDASAFAPSQHSSITSNNIIDNKRTISFILNNLSLDTSLRKIIDISGVVMLGDKQKNEMKLVKADLGDTTYKIYIKNGFLIISDVCQTQFRKIASNLLDFEIVQNPVYDVLKLDIISSITGKYVIKIYSLSGIEIKSEQFNFSKRQKIEKLINISDFQSGLYFVKLFSPNRIVINSFIKL